MAILLLEQYGDFAEELADDYLVMQCGEFIARGTGSEIQDKVCDRWWRSDSAGRKLKDKLG